MQYFNEITDAITNQTIRIPLTAEEIEQYNLLNPINLADSFEKVRKELQSTIDEKAKFFGFSGGNALMLYAGFANAFQSLAQTFATWEASVWVEAEAYKAQVLAGTAPMLSPEDAIAMMPPYPA